MTLGPDLGIEAHEADLLRATLPAITADPRRAAALFYDHLFRLSPGAKNLFVLDMTRQGDKLIATLNSLVLRVEDLPAIGDEIEELGLRHLAYGVREEHFEPTGHALQAMLADLLGDAFDAQTAAAWRKVYAMVAELMINAAARRLSRPPSGD